MSDLPKRFTKSIQKPLSKSLSKKKDSLSHIQSDYSLGKNNPNSHSFIGKIGNSSHSLVQKQNNRKTLIKVQLQTIQEYNSPDKYQKTKRFIEQKNIFNSSKGFKSNISSIKEINKTPSVTKRKINGHQRNHHIKSDNISISEYFDDGNKIIFNKSIQDSNKKINYRNKAYSSNIVTQNNYFHNKGGYSFRLINQTFSTQNSSSELFKKKNTEIQQENEMNKIESRNIKREIEKKGGVKHLQIILSSESNETIKTKRPLKRDYVSLSEKTESSANKFLVNLNCLFANNKSNNNTIINQPNIKEIKTEENKIEELNSFNDQTTLIDADENISIIQPRIIPYIKQIYSNNFLSKTFLSLLSDTKAKIKKCIISYLSNVDLCNLSLVNKQMCFSTLIPIRTKVSNKIISKQGNIIKRIWSTIPSFSSLPKEPSLSEIYTYNLNKENKYIEEITKDLSRTFPNDQCFSNSTNLKKLSRILKTYSNYNKEIGYAQGLNFITARLLNELHSEKKVFVFLDGMIKKTKLNSILGINNSLQRFLCIINNLIEEYAQDLYSYLLKNKVSHELFSANWVITLFSCRAPNDLLHIIWSFFFIYGEKFICSFIVAIGKFYTEQIIKVSSNEFSTYMKFILTKSEFRKDFSKIIDTTIELMSKREWNVFDFWSDKSESDLNDIICSSKSSESSDTIPLENND